MTNKQTQQTKSDYNNMGFNLEWNVQNTAFVWFR